MKVLFRCIVALAAVGAGLSVARAEPSKKPGPPSEEAPPERRSERRLKALPGGPRGLPEMEQATFLGVETAPVSPALTAQLGLPKDAGLVVRSVLPESPAASLLQPHDILLKLDDQLLIEARQFAVLVRNHREGDEVTLTYVRGGKETTGKVKLVTREVPRFGMSGAPTPGGEGIDVVRGREGRPGMPAQEMNRVLALLDSERSANEGGLPPPVRFGVAAPRVRSFQAQKVNPENSNMVFTDDEGSLEVTIKQGKKTLVAKDVKGTQLFSGPVDTPEQRETLPAGVRERFERIDGLREFSFEAGEDFHGDVKIFRPQGTRMVQPLPGPSAESAPQGLLAPPLVF